MVRTTAAKVKAFDVKISKQSHAISMGLSMVMEDPEGSQNRTEKPIEIDLGAVSEQTGHFCHFLPSRHKSCG